MGFQSPLWIGELRPEPHWDFRPNLVVQPTVGYASYHTHQRVEGHWFCDGDVSGRLAGHTSRIPRDLLAGWGNDAPTFQVYYLTFAVTNHVFRPDYLAHRLISGLRSSLDHV